MKPDFKTAADVQCLCFVCKKPVGKGHKCDVTKLMPAVKFPRISPPALAVMLMLSCHAYADGRNGGEANGSVSVVIEDVVTCTLEGGCDAQSEEAVPPVEVSENTWVY